MNDKIFISYRRDDSAANARSIYQTLVSRFGRKRIFLDIETIEKGQNFRESLHKHLAECAVLVAVIGRQWFVQEPDGSQHIGDYVRLEISAALSRKVPVMPVLVDGAQLPDASQLPEDLKELADLQATRVSHENYAADISALCRSIRAHITPQLGLAERISSSRARPGISPFSDSEYGIVVAEIAENAGTVTSDDRTITQVLVDTMSDLLSSMPISNDQAVVVKPLGRAVPAVRGRETVLELARSSKAKLVVWGWYSKDAQSSLIRVNVELGAPDSLVTPFVQNLDDPRVTPANYVEQFGSILSHPRTDDVFNLAFTVSSAQEASASAALIVGFIAYVNGQFDQAGSLLSTLTEQNKRVSPLVRAYTHFLLGNIKLARMATAQLDDPDVRRDALSDYIAASEYLKSGQEYSRPLKAKILNNIGTILISLNDYEQADEFIAESLRQSTGHATTHVNKGRILLARAGYRGDKKSEAEAVASMEKALSINPNLLTPRLWLATVAIRQGDPKRTAEQLEPVFEAFKRLDPQKVSLPDRAVIQFIHEFGPEFSADLVEPKDRERVLAQLSSYLVHQEELFVMFSTMNPQAMSMAGHSAALARSAIARLKQEEPPAKASRPSIPDEESPDDPDTDLRETVQEAISAGRRQDAIQLLTKAVDETDGLGARYTLGKLLFETEDRQGAYTAISQAIDKEINHYRYRERTWTVKFDDGERRATYGDYVDIVMQSIDQQGEYESVVGNLIQRVHLLGVKPITMMLSLKQFTLPDKQKLELLTNLGGALAKEDRFAESADVFAEASRCAEGDEKLNLMLSELKMRTSASQPVETLDRLLGAAEEERKTMQPPPPQYRADYLDQIIGLWRCELALRSGLNGDVRCQEVLTSATYSNKILAAFYGGQMALRRGEEDEWLRLFERAIEEHDAYHSPPSFNRVEIVPQSIGSVFADMLRDLVAYYRRTGSFEKIGKLLFRKHEYSERSLYLYDRQRLKVLQGVSLR